MGQYHMPANLDKKEYITPHAFGDGLKMLEFGCSADGTLTGLTILLACSHDRGGGDLHKERDAWMGRWAGDRIVILGDYSERSDLPGLTNREFADAMAGVRGGRERSDWRDISQEVLRCMCHDPWIREAQDKRPGFRSPV